MKLQLVTPCKNCPFSVSETRIRFSGRERAEEIEEHAYRNGFPCHLSATLDEDDEDGGYEFGPNTQHCAGAILMLVNEGYNTWPGIGNRDLSEKYVERLAPNLHRAFACTEDFLAANDAIVDGRPQGGDAKLAPFTTSDGAGTAIAQPSPANPTIASETSR